MRFDLDMVGAFVPGIAIWLVGGLLVFLGLDAILTRWGFYRLFWNPPLARFALSLVFFAVSGCSRACSQRESRCKPSCACCSLSFCLSEQAFLATRWHTTICTRHGPETPASAPMW